MYRYFGNNDTPKDKDYQKIMEQLDDLMEHLPSEEDRQLLSRMVYECYHKHHEAIKSIEGHDPILFTPLIMALILDQISMIDRLEDNNC